jgi:hypothetical protein
MDARQWGGAPGRIVEEIVDDIHECSKVSDELGTW